MAEEIHVAEPAKAQNKRRVGKKGGSKGKKRPRMLEGMPQNKPKKTDRKMKKLFRKTARDYNSDGDDNDKDEEEEEEKRDVGSDGESEKEEAEEEGLDANGDNGNSDEGEESGRIQPRITMFVEGSRAFKIAFRSIIKKSVPEDALGPVLSAHKKLIAEKLAEEEAERKVKKEKQLLAEKGHVKPANYLDSNGKFLIGVATKGGFSFSSWLEKVLQVSPSLQILCVTVPSIGPNQCCGSLGCGQEGIVLGGLHWQALEIQLHSAQAIEFLCQLPLEPHETTEFFHCSNVASKFHHFRFKNHAHLNSQ